MEKTLNAFVFLTALASLPLAANADITALGTAAPPMTGNTDMSGMMKGMMGGTAQADMMDQMMQMMQMAQMMTDCTKMMADMSMMGKGPDPMMGAPSAPAPKG